MKPPTIELPNLTMVFVQHKLPECVAIERQKIEAGEWASRRRDDQFVQSFIEGNICHGFISRDVLEYGAILLDESIGFGLERVGRIGTFSNRYHRSAHDCCVRLAL